MKLLIIKLYDYCISTSHLCSIGYVKFRYKFNGL